MRHQGPPSAPPIRSGGLLTRALPFRARLFRALPIRTLLLAAAAALTPVSAFPTGPPPSEQLLELLERARFVRSTAISPDGSAILYVVETPQESGWPRPEVFRIQAAGGRPVRVAVGSDPRWLPDGRSATIVTREPEGRRLALVQGVDRDSGPFPSHVLAPELDRVLAVSLSPDGSTAAVVQGPSTPPSEPRDAARAAPNELWAVPLRPGGAGARSLLPDGLSPWLDLSPSGRDLDWSPDSRRLAFAATPPGGGRFDTDVWVLDLERGTLAPAVARPGVDDHPRWSPSGDRLALLSTDGVVDYNANVRLCVLSLARDPTPTCLHDPVGFGILDGPNFLEWLDGSSLLASVAERTGTALLRAPVAGGAWIRLDGSVPEAVRAGLSLDAGRGRLAMITTDLAHPFEVEVTDIEPFAPRRLTRENPEIETLALPRGERIDYRGIDGRRLEGLFLAPPGVERPPLVVMVHGGGPSGVAARAFETAVPIELGPGTLPIQPLVAEGLALFLPNYRGSGAYGEEMRRAVVGRLGSVDVEDVLAGVEALVASGRVDGERVGVMGMSHGALLTALLVERTGRFAAAVTLAGSFDLLSRFGEVPGFELYNTSYFGGPPWERPLAYLAASPLLHAGRIETPTLILHGESDPVVPLTHARQLWTALRARDVASELWIYPQEGHGFYRRDHLTDARRRIVAWFDRWLRSSDGTRGALQERAAPASARARAPAACGSIQRSGWSSTDR